MSVYCYTYYIMTREEKVIIKTPNGKEFVQVLDLRWRVLDEPLSCSHQTLPSKSDEKPDVIHVVALKNNKVVSTVRLDPHPERGDNVFLVRKMATEPRLMRKGIGAKVLDYAESIARKRGAKNIIAHAFKGAVPFYEHMGYKLNGRIEMHDGEETPEMVKSTF